MTNIILIHQLIACVLFFNIVWQFENKNDKTKYSNIFALWCSILLSIFSLIYIFVSRLVVKGLMICYLIY